MNWLEGLLKATEESEAPERYFWWSGLAAISAVTRKNVWINRGGFYNLYPNIYVVLISTKSGARKGIPISICKRLLEEVNLTRIISGCNSIQGMIQELGQQKTLENNVVIGDAHGIMLSDEFDSFLVEDPKALTYLTTLYNTHEHEKGWDKTLKNSPKITLKAPCLTMLVASNEALFDSIVKRKDIEGGFIGRTVMVRETKARGVNSLVTPPRNKISFPELSVRLMEISRIKGEFYWIDESAEFFDKWYRALRAADPDDRTGTYNRLGDQVLKVAMLLSLARKDDLKLEVEDLELAVDKCEECAESASRITPSVESPNGDKPNIRKLIIAGIARMEPECSMSKMELLNKLQPYQVHTRDIDHHVDDLISVGYLVRKMLPGDGNINHRTILTLSEACRRVYLGDVTKEERKLRRKPN